MEPKPCCMTVPHALMVQHPGLQANYMLAVPTIATFCHRIGVSSSLAGAIIGSSDFASMFMTPLYSLWSNHSFKYPVAAGSIACLAGNLLYAFSYDARALWMLMASRFLIGFGVLTSLLSRLFALDLRPTQLLA